MDLPRRLSRVVLFTVAMLVSFVVAMLAPIETRADGLLFGATGSGGVNGELWILNPATGAGTTDLGALVDGSANAYGITGLAFDPLTGFLYGSTANLSPTAPGHLVGINPLNGVVIDLGSFGITHSDRADTFADITFDPTTDKLYGYSAGGHSLYTINLLTGSATLVGLSGITRGGGEGLAADASGTIFGAPTGCGEFGVLDTFSKTNGSPTFVANLSGCPLSGGINALAFDSTGKLFGINNNEGTPSLTHLLTIDTSTGGISDIGSSLDNLDALAFQPSPTAAVPEPSTMALLGAGLAGIVGRKFRTKRYRGRSSGQ
jgi:hypothetical protein